MTALSLIVIAMLSMAAAAPAPEDVVIKLERTRCFGICPIYSVTIDAQGRVTYDGEEFVRITGRQTDTIPASKVAALVEIIDRIGFFTLQEQYTEIHRPNGHVITVTDLPTTYVTVTRDGVTRRVKDYIGAPEGLHTLEEAIDDAANTKRWIWYDEHALQERITSGWTPSAAEVQQLLREAVQRDDATILQSAIDLGADPSAVGQYGDTPLCNAAVHAPALTATLLKANAPVDQPCDSEGSTPLWNAAQAGNADVVKLLLNAAANPTITARGLSPIAAAREAKKARESDKDDPVEIDKPLFRVNFTTVITLLEQAVAARQPRR